MAQLSFSSIPYFHSQPLTQRVAGNGKVNFLPLFLPKSAVVSNFFLILANRNILNQHYAPTPTDIQHARGGGLTYGLAVPPGMAGPLCFRAFTSHDNSNYKQF